MPDSIVTFDAPVEWLVVFQSMEPESAFPPGDQYGDRFGKAVRGLLRRVLRRGFQHVFAMRRADHFDGWVLVNLRGPGLDVIEIPGNAYLHDVVLPMCCTPDAAMVRAEVKDNGFIFRHSFNCVQFIGHLLGIRLGIFATPWYLYNILVSK